MTFRRDAKLDPKRVRDVRNRPVFRVGGRSLRKRGVNVGGLPISLEGAVSAPRRAPSTPLMRRGVRNDRTPAGRLRIRKAASTRFRFAFGKRAPLRRITRGNDD